MLKLKGGHSTINYSPNKGHPIKNFFANRKSKQEIKEKSMFGSGRGKTPKIGKKFGGNMKSSSISPDIEEFDKMLSGGKSSKSKKSLFKKK